MCERWPDAMVNELRTFSWPLTTIEEVRRLFDCRYADPRDVVVCEYTAAVATANEAVHGELTLTIEVCKGLRTFAFGSW